MNTFRTVVESDERGFIHIPGMPPHQKLELIVVWNENPQNNQGVHLPSFTQFKTEQQSQPNLWPIHFFEQFAGAFAEDPIERGDQGSVDEIATLDFSHKKS